MHISFFTNRTQVVIKSCKPHSSFLPGFNDFGIRLFCKQRFYLVSLLCTQYSIIPDLNKSFWKNMHAAIACNLRRIGNILTLNVLKEYLRMLVSLFLAIFDLTGAVLRHFGLNGALKPELADIVKSPGNTGIHTGSRTK